jgi:hypothetical protein
MTVLRSLKTAARTQLNPQLQSLVLLGSCNVQLVQRKAVEADAW